MRRRFPTGLKVFLIIASVFLTFYGFLFIQVARAVSWKVHEDLTDKQKTEFGEMARMPGLAPSVERYGIKGWQDAEYLIETYRYDSVDAMCGSLPDGCRDSIEKSLETGTPTSAKDVKGKRIKRYDHIPFRGGRSDTLVFAGMFLCLCEKHYRSHRDHRKAS